MKMNKALKAAALAAILIVLEAAPALAQDAGNRFTVLTFNVWGIIGAKERMVRMDAIGKRISELNPDIIAIEEAFEGRHRRELLKSLDKNGYKYADKRYFKNVYGSGIFFISKYPIEKAVFEPYRVIGGPWDIEWIGGKGIAYLRLATPWGPLDFFHTHAIARMTAIFDDQGNYIPGDPKEIDRLLNMYQIDRFVESYHTGESRSIVAAGDFNVSPEMLEYPFLKSLTGFESSFEKLHPGENPSTFSKEDVWVKDDFSRIDHIFYKNYEGSEGFWVKPVESRLVMNQKFEDPKSGKEINYSDHYGLLTVFEVVTEEGAVPYSPPGIDAATCPCREKVEGYAGGPIQLDSDNLGEWQRVAMMEFARAYRKQARKDKALVPLAEIMATSPSELPREIEVPPAAEKRIKEIANH